ncbi:MAG: endospore germination permease, partial [Tepidanaerobacteraceae bacterium]|nr:endospore germination permease [Tepidanaerobacteraceae bacterium]
VGVLYIWFFAHRTAIILRQFGEFLTNVFYQETPILVFITITSIVVVYAVRQGIETICRVGEILFPIIIFAIIFVIAFIAKDMDLKILTPVMENGILPAVYGAFVIAPRTTGILFLSMLMPYINNPKKTKTYLGLGYIFITFFFVLTTISIVTLFGVEQAKLLVFPFYNVVRMISLGDFFERIDAVFGSIWVLGMFVNIAINYYITVLAAAQLLKLQDYRSLSLAMGTIIVSLSIFQSESMISLNEFLSYKIYTWYTLFFIVVLPLFLLITAVIRKKGDDSR